MLRGRAVKLRRCILPLFVASMLVGGTTRADDDSARARALFDEAGELERQGQWSAAQDRLRTALRLRETPHLRYALAWALENDDKLLEARAEYEAALRLAQRGGNDDIARLAAARIPEVVKKTPTAAVRVPGGSLAGARVVVDGRSAPLQNDVASIAVNPGSRVIRVEQPGRPATEQLVYVPRGATVDVEAASPDSVAKNAAVQMRPASERVNETHGRPVLPWVLIGGGAVLVVAGGALLLSSSSDASARDENTRQWCAATQCTNGNAATIAESAEAAAYRREATDAAERGNTKQGLGFVLGAAGIVTAAVGTYLFFRGEADRNAAVQIGAAPAPGGAMAGATIRF
jgi:hypothetical protein